MWIKERPERISCIGTGNWTDPEHTMEDTVLLLCKTQRKADARAHRHALQASALDDQLHAAGHKGSLREQAPPR